MKKSQMTVGQDYAVSFGYGREPLGSEYGVERGRLVRFEGNDAVFDRRHSVSGRSRKWGEERVSLNKVPGTWQQHLDALAASKKAQEERVADLENEAALRNTALSFLDQMVPGWDKGEFTTDYAGSARYEVTSWMSPRDYYSEGRERVTLHGDKSGVSGGKGEVTVVFLAALVEAAFKAGQASK